MCATCVVVDLFGCGTCVGVCLRSSGVMGTVTGDGSDKGSCGIWVIFHCECVSESVGISVVCY